MIPDYPELNDNNDFLCIESLIEKKPQNKPDNLPDVSVTESSDTARFGVKIIPYT